MRLDSEWRGVVADIGGTNARLAIAELAQGRCSLRHQAVFEVGAYDDFAAILKAYRQQNKLLASECLPATIAVAGAVRDNRVTLTNIDRVIDGDRLVAAGFFKSCLLVNDFAALAASLPLLQAADRSVIGGPGRPVGDTRLVVGPGTGLGAALLTNANGRYLVLPGEGGHAAFAPYDDTEVEILRLFQRRYPERVSYERILSGRGLAELHETLTMMAARPVQPLSSEQITKYALEGDESARETLDRFFAILGSFAGDLALIGGSWGGIYVGGGIIPSVEQLFDASPFRQRLEAKGRFADKLAQVPSYLITAPMPALLGAALLASRG